MLLSRLHLAGLLLVDNRVIFVSLLVYRPVLRLLLLPLLVLVLLLLLLLGHFLLHHLLLLLLDLQLSLLVSFLLVQESVVYLFGKVKVNSVVFNESSDSLSAIVDLAHLNEHRDEIKQLPIVRVIVPRYDRYGALRLEHVRRRGVIQDHRILHISSYLRHVFCIHPVEIRAMLSEKPHGADTLWIHQVHERICILAETCSEDNDFVILRHHFQKVVNSRPFRHEDVADRALDVHWDGVVRVLDLLELTMNQSLIQIKNKGFQSSRFFRWRPQHPKL